MQEEQTIQWPKEKRRKGKQWKTIIYTKTKDWATRIPLKFGMKSGAPNW
jgi:hypothetical protein